MYSSLAALPLNTLIVRTNIPYVSFNYCDLPHLVQNFAFFAITAPHIMQSLPTSIASLLLMEAGLVSEFSDSIGFCCCSGWGLGSVYCCVPIGLPVVATKLP